VKYLIGNNIELFDFVGMIIQIQLLFQVKFDPLRSEGMINVPVLVMTLYDFSLNYLKAGKKIMV